jgi:biofilm PGA synthesis N-glycosyltransferase PgaC
LYLAASALSRANQKPYVVGSLAIMWGWIKSAALRKPRYENSDFRRFLRRYQMRALLVGKRRAIAELTAAIPRRPTVEPPP